MLTILFLSYVHLALIFLLFNLSLRLKKLTDIVLFENARDRCSSFLSDGY